MPYVAPVAAVPECPVDQTLKMLSGKWRLTVLFRLAEGPKRFNALQRSLAPITQRVLTATLRQLEEDELIWRAETNDVPPSVTYGLTSAGSALAPVFEALATWGVRRTGRGRSAPE